MQAVELFTGAGGLGIGVSQAGFKPVAVVERDRYCCDTIRENQERRLAPLADWPLVQGDVRDFDYGGISGDTDLVSGGPPCQPLSSDSAATSALNGVFRRRPIQEKP